MPEIRGSIQTELYSAWHFTPRAASVSEEVVVLATRYQTEGRPPHFNLALFRNACTIQQLMNRHHHRQGTPEFITMGYEYWLFAMDNGTNLQEWINLWQKQ